MYLTCKVKINKIYFIIDQQIARYFVQYSECLTNYLPFYATQIIYTFLNSRISCNHDKAREGILDNREIPLNAPLV